MQIMIYSSARGGARTRMMAPRVTSPNTGKRAPPKSPELEAIICVFCARSAKSMDLMALAAGEDTVQ